MKTQLHFVHTNAAADTQGQVRDWIESYLSDLETASDLNVELYLTKQSANRKSIHSRFACIISAKASWMTKPITVRTVGQECWDTIVESCHRLRHQMTKIRRKRLNQKRRRDHMTEISEPFS